MRNLCKNSPRTRKKSRQRIKCFKQKLWTILRYRKRFFFILAKSQKCGFESQKCLLIIVWSHFLTKIVFLQLSIIKIFYAHENSFFHHIFLSQLANKNFLRKRQANLHRYQIQSTWKGLGLKATAWLLRLLLKSLL